MLVYTHDFLKAIMLVQREQYWVVSEYTPGRRVFHLMPTEEGFLVRLATIVEEHPHLEQSITIRPYLNEGREEIVPKAALIEKHEHPWCKGEPYGEVWNIDLCLIGLVNADRKLYLCYYPMLNAPKEELQQMVMNDWYAKRSLFTAYALPMPDMKEVL